MAKQNTTTTTDCNNDSNKKTKETFVSKYGYLFIAVLSVFTLVFIGLLLYANKEFRNSQKRIITCYEQHIHQSDSLYHDMVNYNARYILNINELSTKVSTDSLIKKTLNSKKGISKEQYNNLSKIITSYFDDMRQLNKQYDIKIRHDSLLILAEEQLLKGQTNRLLELHLNKVEHEYSNITIWAAVLTILFLVFSFYSIFKVDELVQQGSEGVRDIRKLRDDGNTLLSETKQNLATYTNEQQQIIVKTRERFIEQANDCNSKIDEVINKAYTSIEDFRKETAQLLKEELDRINFEQNLQINKKVELLDTYIENLKAFMKANSIQLKDSEEVDKNE